MGMRVVVGLLQNGAVTVHAGRGRREGRREAESDEHKEKLVENGHIKLIPSSTCPPSPPPPSIRLMYVHGVGANDNDRLLLSSIRSSCGGKELDCHFLSLELGVFLGVVCRVGKCWRGSGGRGKSGRGGIKVKYNDR